MADYGSFGAHPVLKVWRLYFEGIQHDQRLNHHRLRRKIEKETLQRELLKVNKRLMVTQLHEALVTNLTTKLKLRRDIFGYKMEIAELKEKINKLE